MTDAVAELVEGHGKVLTDTATTVVRYVKASSIRVGDYIMIGDRACKVVTVSVSKTGKHGYTKVRVDFSDDGSDSAVYSTVDDVQVMDPPEIDPAVVAQDAAIARAWEGLQ